MLDNLKRANLDGQDIEELIYLSAVAKHARAEFEIRNVDVPEWLDTRIRELGREIGRRTEDKRAARLRELKAQQATLLTPAEKREKIEQEIAALEAIPV